MSHVVIRLLPDGSGRVRIHFFARDPRGPVTTPSGSVLTALGPIRLGGSTGRIVCQPQLTSIAPRASNNETHPVVHSDDPRAVSCPECMATEVYKAAFARVAHTVRPREPGE